MEGFQLCKSPFKALAVITGTVFKQPDKRAALEQSRLGLDEASRTIRKSLLMRFTLEYTRMKPGLMSNSGKN